MIKNNRGFTLIELIATIAIMAMIMGIAIPTSINFINDAKEKEYDIVLDEIKIATRKYYNENNVTFTSGKASVDISSIIDYVDLDEDNFRGNKIKDPRSDDKCLSGSITLTQDSSSEQKDKINITTENISTTSC